MALHPDAQDIRGGGIYLLTGFVIHRIKGYLLSPLWSVPIILVSICLYAFDLMFYDIIGGVALFLLSVKISVVSNNVFIVMRRLSMWIYYIHMIVIFILSIVLPTSKMSLIQFFLISSFLSFIISTILDYLSMRVRTLKFLQFLIK